MKKLLIGLVLTASLYPNILSAQTNPQFNVTQYRAAFAVETLTVSNSVKVLTASVYAPTTNCSGPAQCNADYALITVEAAASACLRFWPDGTSPTTTVGHRYCDAQAFFIDGYKNIANLKMIRVTTDVTIQVSYYRYSTNSMQ